MKKIVALPRFRPCSYRQPLQSTPPALAANCLLIARNVFVDNLLRIPGFFQKSVCPQPLLLSLLVGLSGWSPLPISYYRLATTNKYIIIAVYIAIIDLNYVLR